MNPSGCVPWDPANCEGETDKSLLAARRGRVEAGPWAWRLGCGGAIEVEVVDGLLVLISGGYEYGNPLILVVQLVVIWNGYGYEWFISG